MKNIEEKINKVFLQKKQTVLIVFFFCLFSLLLFLFQRAFQVDFFLDDFFFVKIGRANTLLDFLRFFSPLKDYFYRPIPTETFYFFINLFKQNLFIAHSVVFLVYFLGLIFLYRSAYKITKTYFFSFLFVFMYAISSVHIFQLYQLATFIEVALFSFLTVSFYYFLEKKYVISLLFFILALMSKESAALFPVALVGYQVLKKQHLRESLKLLLPYVVLTGIFLFMYKIGTSKVIAIDTYKIQMNPRLITNNFLWYLFWSFGIPNFVPNYVKSIFFQPLPEFWNLLNTVAIRHYFYLLITYFVFFGGTVIAVVLRNKKNMLLFGFGFLVLLFYFGLFILPTLPIIHRWEVRLTVPLIFVIAMQAWILYKAFFSEHVLRIISVCLIMLYVIISFLGITLQESSSLILYNSQIVKHTRVYMNLHKDGIEKKNALFFVDQERSIWHSSYELENVLGQQNFLVTFLPGFTKPALYGFKTPLIPKGSYVIDSKTLF